MIEKRFVTISSPLSSDEAGSSGIAGLILPYGEKAKLAGFTEEFKPGAFANLPTDLILNRQHDRAQPLARTPDSVTLTETDQGIQIEADLSKTQPAREALEEVRAGILRGFSVEFRALRDSWLGKHRIVEKAVLVDVALVDRPAYEGATVKRRYSNPRKIPTWAY